MKRASMLAASVAIAVVTLLSGDARSALATGNGIQGLVEGADVGRYTSLALDASGNPVVSFQDYEHGDLLILHCNDANCDDDDDSLTSPDTGGLVGFYTSIALDASGNPVVSYHDETNGDLKVMHCDDPNCAGGNESITSPDTAIDSGSYTSLVLDCADFDDNARRCLAQAGNPVVSYLYNDNLSNYDLKVMHCNDANCAGGGESITSPDAGGDTGLDTSLALDGSGFPVISYYDFDSDVVRLLHCNDANCAGGGENVTTVSVSNGGATSLQLDIDGFPVISHLDYNASEYHLSVTHCNDANCATYTTNNIEVAGTGDYTSLRLDGSGNPVVAYHDVAGGNLKLLHCNDADCAGGDDAINAPDTVGSVGSYPSMALDASGKPLVSYADATNDAVKLLHCSNVNCSTGGSIISRTRTVAADGIDISLVLDSSGNPVMSYYDPRGGGALTIIRCNDPNCAGGDETEIIPVGRGRYSSIVLNSSDLPRVSFYDETFGQLELLICGNPTCASFSLDLLDSAGDVGRYSSMKLDSSGNPVIAYRDETNSAVKLLRCDDPVCAGVDTPITVDNSANVGHHTSLDLFSAPFTDWAAISYYDSSSDDPRTAHCTAANVCGSIALDTGGDVGRDTSIAADVIGFFPEQRRVRISYQDTTNGDLKVAYCRSSFDPNWLCDLDATSQSPDMGASLGTDTSMELDASGYPVVSYQDDANGDLKVMHCNDPNCAGGNESIVTVDGPSSVGGYTSLELDSSGFPVVAYYDLTANQVKVLHCVNANCSGATKSGDTDGDGCPDVDEQQTAVGSETSGGRRNYLNPNDYFNPTGDGLNRIDDVIAVVNQYFDDFYLPSPPNPPNTPNSNYDPDTDRTDDPAYDETQPWRLLAGNGLQRIDDILAQIKQFFHDCS